MVDLENTSIKDAVNQLILAGIEVDNATYIDQIQDTILDISITTNRQDITGWAAVAIELSAAIRKPLKIKIRPSNIQIRYLPYLKNLDLFTELHICHINHACTVNKNQSYTKYLNALNLHNTNSTIDLITFANLKWGQAIHVYGLATEEIPEIGSLIFEAKSNSSNAKADELKVYINNQAVPRITKRSIEEYNNICSILLISYRLKEQKSGYFSLNGSIDCCLNAYSEILSTLGRKTSNTNIPPSIFCFSQNRNRKKYILSKIQDINKTLGPIVIKNDKKFLDTQTITQITKSLNLETECSNNKLKVVVPAARKDDIKSTIDITEEIARIYGFDNFYDNLPKFKNIHPAAKKVHIEDKIRRIIRSMGLHEVINYSFQSRNVKYKSIHIVNPLNQEQKVLRENLINGMIINKIYNTHQGNSNFEVFEIGSVFIKNEWKKEYQELKHLSCLLGNNIFNQSTWQTRRNPLTWLQVKGHAEELFERINAQISWSNSPQANDFTHSLSHYIHPTKSIYIESQNHTIGVLSQINWINESLHHTNYFIEINLSKLVETIKTTNHLQYTYNQYSNYPKITRDFSIKISSKIPVKAIESIIKNMQNQYSNIIESVFMISEYHNSINEKTICLRITYRSKHRTLTNEEIEILDNMLKLKLRPYSRARHKPGSVLNSIN